MKFFLLKIHIIILLILPEAYSQNNITFPQMIRLLDDIKSKEMIQKSEGFAEWSTDNSLFTSISAIRLISDASTIYMCTANQNDEPVVFITASPLSEYYNYMYISDIFNNGWHVAIQATDNQSISNLVELWNKNNQRLFVGNNDNSLNPTYIAAPYSEKLYAIILLDEFGVGYKSILLYNLVSKSVITICNYATQKKEIKRILSRTNNGQWIEYIFSEKEDKLKAVALLDSVTNFLKTGYFDFTSNGKIDLALGSDLKTNKSFVVKPEINDINELLPQNLTNIIVKAGVHTTNLWKQLNKRFFALKALGYKFPKKIDVP